jgi:hypothetical protein
LDQVIHHSLLKGFEEIPNKKMTKLQFLLQPLPRWQGPLPTISPASSRRPFLNPTRQSTVMLPAVLPLRNDTTIGQSTARPPVPIRNLQRNIEPANQNQQDYKRKYEETLLRL